MVRDLVPKLVVTSKYFIITHSTCHIIYCIINFHFGLRSKTRITAINFYFGPLLAYRAGPFQVQ